MLRLFVLISAKSRQPQKLFGDNEKVASDEISFGLIYEFTFNRVILNLSENVGGSGSMRRLLINDDERLISESF